MRETVLRAAAPFILVCVFGLFMSGCAGGQTDGGTLTVGVRSDIANFGYYNRNTDKYYGLEIDFAKELAGRLGYADISFVAVDPTNREEKLEEGEVDCLIACYTITDERKERFDISSPYYTDSVVIMVERSSMIGGADELAGKRIGVLEGSATAQQITKVLQGVEFCTMDSYDKLIAALEEGRIDAVSTDGCILQQYMTKEREYIDIKISEQPYGVAMKKNSGLTKKMEEAVQGICSDGTMEALADKWR